MKVTYLKKCIQKSGLALLLVTISHCSFSQDAYMNILDTGKSNLFRNFIGLKLYATDIGATSANRNLEFQYQSNNLGYIYNFEHNLNVTGLHSFYNLGLGLNENLGKHLDINFFNTSLGYIQNMWDWNVGAGVGYFVSLNKEKTMRLTASMNIYFESITYNLGSDYDSTQLGFIVNGVNIGTAIKGVRYVNDIWSVTPGIEFLYRRSNIDFFAGVYYNYPFSHNEKVNFFKTSESIPNTIFYTPNSSNYVPGNVTNLGRYVIQIGIVREFGI